MELPPASVFAFVKLGSVVPLRGPLTDAEALKLRARYVAGVHSIAAGAAATSVQPGEGLDFWLIFEGTQGTALAQRAMQAARHLRERAFLDLDLSARVVVHAAALSRASSAEQVVSKARQLCERLEQAIPQDSLAVSPAVYLVLPEELRRQLSPPVPLLDDGTAASLSPAPPASPPPSAETRLQERFRGYLQSPEVRRLRYVGFRLHRKSPPSLDIHSVFVVPSVESMQRDMPTPATERLLFPEAFRRHSSLVILGEPGSGKSTLLKWLAVVGAQGPLATHDALGEAADLLPLLVSVGRLSELRTALGGAASVTKALARYFQERGVDPDETLLEGFLEKVLQEGRGLVLLDGLDEVRGDAQNDVLRWLEAFSNQYPHNRFITSARQVGYRGITLPHGVEVTLAGFSDEQIQRYVNAFCRAYRVWEDGEADPVTAEREATQLLSALEAHRRLHDISRNPFILSCLALIHRAEGRLPRHRVHAYEILTRTLCETWGQARRLVAGEATGEQINYEEEAIPVLGRLALEMHRQWPTGVAPEPFVVKVLTEAIQEREGSSAEVAQRAAHQFLAKAGASVQILLERGAGQWGFLHLTFQEFFAALGLYSTEAFEAEVFKRLFQSRWEEVLRLGIGYMALVQKRMEAAQRIIGRILEHEEPAEPDGFITRVLRKQVPLAALMATEVGDALSAQMQERLMRQFSDWLCTMPYGLGLPFFTGVSRSSLSKRLLAQLLLLAEDARAYVRAHALYYLGKLKDPSAGAAILSALKQQEGSVLVSAALAASELKLQEASATLNKLLSHSKADVKLSAALAVLSLKPDSAEAIVDRLMRNKAPAAREALGKFLVHLDNLPEGPILVEKVLQDWESSDKPSHQISARTTRRKLFVHRDQGIKGTFESPAIEELLKAGAGINESIQFLEAWTFENLEHVDVPLIIRELVKVSAHIDRPSPKIDPETLNDAELVRELLGSDERGLAALALHLLVLQPSPEGLNLLLELLGGTDDFLRKEAAEFLGRLRARVAIPLLVQMAHSTDDKERDVALEALWSIASSD
jgi:energy-coupling factor transporter ATP-binding protein EcfA2